MTNYERLVMEVWTNGTITPDEAMSQAAQLIQGHLDIYTSLAEVEEASLPPAAAEEPEEEDSILDASIDTLELSIRSMNCLKNANIRTLRDLVSRSEKEMVEIRNFGEKSLKEVRSKLEVLGLGFGMNLDL
jgi:DNA-directed RNA polymerase subunit alpha